MKYVKAARLNKGDIVYLSKYVRIRNRHTLSPWYANDIGYCLLKDPEHNHDRILFTIAYSKIISVNGSVEDSLMRLKLDSSFFADVFERGDGTTENYLRQQQNDFLEKMKTMIQLGSHGVDRPDGYFYRDGKKDVA
jgi:hypothetical protein